VSARLAPGWILGPKADALVFTGPVLVGLALWWLLEGVAGVPRALPPWAFALLIVGCDVAHVWATAFRVYLDPTELRRRPALYVGVPLACLGLGVALYGSSAALFWRVLAYTAAFHFVRQQWGWVAYSRRRAAEEGALDLWLDRLAIYNATLFPLLWWHAHLPRAFVWFLAGDFVAGVPVSVSAVGHVLHWSLVALWLGRQVQRAWSGQGVNLAKLQVMATTWVAWYGGIVLLDSDVAFTALNVLSHGVPYLAVVHRIERERRAGGRRPFDALFAARRGLVFLAVLVAVGYAEEYLWDRWVWHEHAWLFPGAERTLGPLALTFLVPLLALPQATHYVLDGWIWRTHDYPELAAVSAARLTRT